MPTVVIVALLAVCAVSCVYLAPAATAEAAALSSAENGGVYYIHVPITDEELLAGTTPYPTSVRASNSFGNSFALFSGYWYKATVSGEYYCLDLVADTAFYVNATDLEPSWVLDSATVEIPDSPTPQVTLTAVADASYWDSWLRGDPENYTFALVGYTDSSKSGVYFIATPKSGSLRFYDDAPLDAFTAFTVPLHSDDAARLEQLQAAQVPEGDGTIEPPDLGSDSIRIALIIGMAVPVVIIALLLFKPSRAKGGDRKELRRGGRRPAASPVDYDRDRSYGDGRDRYERGYRDYERNDYYEREARRDYDRGYDDRRNDYPDYDDRR